MSKSLGNVVDPLAVAESYGVDAFRYFLMAEMVRARTVIFPKKHLSAVITPTSPTI